MYYRDLINEGIDPDEDRPAGGRCYGPAYDGSHGCGRFVADGGFMCPRCRDESEAYWHEDIARMAQLDAEFDMQANALDVYWQSPEGQAEMATHAAYIADCDASGPSIAHKTFLSLDDLPF